MRKILKDIKDYIRGTESFSYNAYDYDKFLYPIDLEFTLQNSDFFYSHIDNNGVPYRIYSSVGKQYNPTRIAAYALAHYNHYINKQSNKSKKIFMNMANWFLLQKSARYIYSFDWNDLKAPWLSCMAQGEAASVLIRAYKLTKKQCYLDHALKSLEPLFVGVDKGGVQSLIDNKYIFLEEYPNSKNLHVLNGFLFALIGLIETRILTENIKLKSLEEQLVSSLLHNLDCWGDGHWSYYQIDKNQIFKNYCTPSYHNLHITQLEYINFHYPDERIKRVISLWRNGSKNPIFRTKAFFGKVIYRTINKAQK